MKWTYEICKNEALKYQTKRDFRTANRNICQAMLKKGWWDEMCKHMRVLGNKYYRCIYAYEFDDNHVYIGLTSDIVRRDKEHMSPKRKSSVQEYMISTGLIPKLIQLTKYMPCQKAAIQEGVWLNKYAKDGWKTINKNATGSLTLSNTIYTKKVCKEIIQGAEYLSDVYRKHTNLLHLCKVNGWHKRAIASLKTKKNKNGYWTKERCIEIAKKFHHVKDFKKQANTAYRISSNKGWLVEITSHMFSSRHLSGYWTKERCKEASMKYSNRSSFMDGEKGAYDASVRHKWLNELFPKAMLRKKNLCST